jgi:hypothetical protein
MTEIARRAISTRHLRHTHAAEPARRTSAPAVDRHFGAVFVTPLSTREYLLLSDPDVRRWPLGGWVLLDAQDTVVGYHWHQLYPTLDTDWTSRTTALAAFIPDVEQREWLAADGWTVWQDGDTALLGPYLCGTPRPWEQTP